MPIGKRIYTKRELPSKELIEEFSKIPSANVGDVMCRSCGMDPRIKLISSPKNPIVAGPALTVKTCSGDNLTIHAALNMAQEGDFIVVANEGGSARSLIGDVMMAYLYHTKKVAGIILDGPIRDTEAISKWDFPVYATGSNPGGPHKDGPGEVNVPIACGNISVHPGDIILADADGIVVIPKNDAEAILPEAKKFQAQDNEKFIAAKNGTANRAWVEKSLLEKGYEIIDEVYKP